MDLWTALGLCVLAVLLGFLFTAHRLGLLDQMFHQVGDLNILPLSLVSVIYLQTFRDCRNHLLLVIITINNNNAEQSLFMSV